MPSERDRLHDGLSAAEWQRRRAQELGGAQPAGGVAPSDQLSSEAWQAERRAQFTGGDGSRRIDPRRTEVFRRGPDGKLHPIDGWRTTGPFEVGVWAKNVDWLGAGGDLVDIAAGVAGWIIPGRVRAAEKAGLLANFWNAGRDTANELHEIDRRRQPRP